MGNDLRKGPGNSGLGSTSLGNPVVAFHRDEDLNLGASVVTIGAFDGVHRGHQELLRLTIAAARLHGVPAVVYTFDPPPKVYFGQAEALNSLAEKLERIATFGPDHVVVADFNRIYARRTAAEFIVELRKLHPQQILVGEDFRFGSCKSGNALLLRRYFDTSVLPPVRCGDGEIVSSSRIRALRQSGLTAAAAVLENWKDVLTASPATLPSRATLRVSSQ